MDAKPNRRDKAAFLNSVSGVAWTASQGATSAPGCLGCFFPVYGLTDSVYELTDSLS